MTHAQKTLYVKPINRKAAADAIGAAIPKLKGTVLFTQESCDVNAANKKKATIRQQTLNLNRAQWAAVHKATEGLVEDVYVNGEYRTPNPRMPKGVRGSKKQQLKIAIMEDVEFNITDKQGKITGTEIRKIPVRVNKPLPKYRPMEQ